MRRINNSLTSFFSRTRISLDRFYRGLSSILFLVRVDGESLWPMLVPGKRYFASGLLLPRVGDFAVFRNPRDPARVFVKRVAGVKKDFYRMESVVSWGASSDDFGVVSKHFIWGKIYGTEN